MDTERADGRKIDGFPFTIYADGTVLGARGHPISTKLPADSNRRLLAWYGTAARKQSIAIHVLVCTAFHGPRPSPSHEVCHINGVPHDNRAENLAWGTRKENARDRVMHAHHNWTRLTWDQVDEIRSAYAEGKTSYRRLATEHGVSVNTIMRVVKHLTYRRQRGN